MYKLKKVKNILSNGEEIVDIILKELDKKPSKIRQEIEYKIDKSERTVNRRFEELTNLLYGKEIKLSSYLEDLKKENLSSEDKIKLKNEIKLYRNNIKHLEILDRYKFCDISIDNNKEHIDITDYNKFAEFVFSDEMYIYPYFGEEYRYFGKDIYDFNTELLHRYIDDKEERELDFIKFEKFYSKHNPMIINGFIYKINDRDWFYKNLDKIKYINISDDLTKYKTIFYKTRDALEVIKEIQDGDIEFLYSDKVKSSKYLYHIKNNDDIEKAYYDSVEELVKGLHDLEVPVFRELINIENSINNNSFTLRDLVKSMPVCYRSEFLILYRQVLISLLIKGYIFIK